MDVMAVVSEFQKRPWNVKCFNSTYLVLIPKKENAESLNDYRPTSLLNGIYKIITKALANRLRGVVGRLIDNNQSAFLKGTSILDNYMAAYECIHEQKIRRKQCFLFKIDFEKAYDRVNWKCLFRILQLMWFEEQWIEWVRSCVKTARFSVLANGTACGYFRSSRGLRQGDPLSRLLFPLVGQFLSAMWTKARVAGFIEGIKVGRGTKEVTHLQYADGTILFSSAVEEKLFSLRY